MNNFKSNYILIPILFVWACTATFFWLKESGKIQSTLANLGYSQKRTFKKNLADEYDFILGLLKKTYERDSSTKNDLRLRYLSEKFSPALRESVTRRFLNSIPSFNKENTKQTFVLRKLTYETRDKIYHAELEISQKTPKLEIIKAIITLKIENQSSAEKGYLVTRYNTKVVGEFPKSEKVTLSVNPIVGSDVQIPCKLQYAKALDQNSKVEMTIASGAKRLRFEAKEKLLKPEIFLAKCKNRKFRINLVSSAENNTLFKTLKLQEGKFIAKRTKQEQLIREIEENLDIKIAE